MVGGDKTCSSWGSLQSRAGWENNAVQSLSALWPWPSPWFAGQKNLANSKIMKKKEGRSLEWPLSIPAPAQQRLQGAKSFWRFVDTFTGLQVLRLSLIPVIAASLTEVVPSALELTASAAAWILVPNGRISTLMIPSFLSETNNKEKGKKPPKISPKCATKGQSVSLSGNISYQNVTEVLSLERCQVN